MFPACISSFTLIRSLAHSYDTGSAASIHRQCGCACLDRGRRTCPTTGTLVRPPVLCSPPNSSQAAPLYTGQWEQGRAGPTKRHPRNPRQVWDHIACTMWDTRARCSSVASRSSSLSVPSTPSSSFPIPTEISPDRIRPPGNMQLQPT